MRILRARTAGAGPCRRRARAAAAVGAADARGRRSPAGAAQQPRRRRRPGLRARAARATAASSSPSAPGTRVALARAGPRRDLVPPRRPTWTLSRARWASRSAGRRASPRPTGSAVRSGWSSPAGALDLGFRGPVVMAASAGAAQRGPAGRRRSLQRQARGPGDPRGRRVGRGASQPRAMGPRGRCPRRSRARPRAGRVSRPAGERPGPGDDRLAVGQRDDGLHRRARAVRGGALPRRRSRGRALDPGLRAGAAAGARRAASTPSSCAPGALVDHVPFVVAAGARRTARAGGRPAHLHLHSPTRTSGWSTASTSTRTASASTRVAPGEHDACSRATPSWAARSTTSTATARRCSPPASAAPCRTCGPTTAAGCRTRRATWAPTSISTDWLERAGRGPRRHHRPGPARRAAPRCARRLPRAHHRQPPRVRERGDARRVRGVPRRAAVACCTSAATASTG